MSHKKTEAEGITDDLRGDPTEQQYPPERIFVNDGEKVYNKTSWEPSGKNKIEHRHQKHPDEHKPSDKRMLS